MIEVIRGQTKWVFSFGYTNTVWDTITGFLIEVLCLIYQQPLRLDIKRKLQQRTERVKCVDLHPTEPWLLTAQYNGEVCIWNTNTNALVKSYPVTELPVRSAKFVPSKQWVIAGADDMFLRVYNYNTNDKVGEIKPY